MVYQAGTSASMHHSVGVGVTSGGVLGLGGAQTTSASITTLAARVAPPELKKKSPLQLPIVLGAAVLFVVVDGFIAKTSGVALFALVIVMQVQRFKWNHQTYPKLVEEWERSWVCHTCGNEFLQ